MNSKKNNNSNILDGEKVEIGSKIRRYKECDVSDVLGDKIKMIDEAEIEKIAQKAVEQAKKAVEEGK